MTYTEIALCFSNGAFAKVYPFLSDHIEWDVIGESVFTGKAAVLEQCEKTAAYFQSVRTEFNTESILAQDQQVAISGTAAFYKNEQRIAFVRACDLYRFDESGQLLSIRSYCISDQQ